jgi:hypothetical protein
MKWLIRITVASGFLVAVNILPIGGYLIFESQRMNGIAGWWIGVLLDLVIAVLWAARREKHGKL